MQHFCNSVKEPDQWMRKADTEPNVQTIIKQVLLAWKQGKWYYFVTTHHPVLLQATSQLESLLWGMYCNNMARNSATMLPIAIIQMIGKEMCSSSSQEIMEDSLGPMGVQEFSSTQIIGRRATTWRCLPKFQNFMGLWHQAIGPTSIHGLSFPLKLRDPVPYKCRVLKKLATKCYSC